MGLPYRLDEILPPTWTLFQVGCRKHPSVNRKVGSVVRTGGAKAEVYVRLDRCLFAKFCGDVVRLTVPTQNTSHK